MSTDEGTTSEPDATLSDDPPGPSGDGAAAPSWWHRDHPIFSALSGFFTGLVTVIVVPGAYAAILNSVFSNERAEDFFVLGLVLFVIPLGLIAAPRTRRFGTYMLLGMALTAAVVLGVAALVLWVLYSRDS
jgi:hypothetical protein